MKSFKEYITEIRIKLKGFGEGSGSEGADNFLKEFDENSTPHPFNRSRIYHNTAVELSKDGNQVHLHDIQSLEPKKGYGSNALKHLTALADKHGVKINLYAKAYAKDKKYLTNSVKLGKWYHKHGFRFDDPDHKLNDYHDGADMIYHPK